MLIVDKQSELMFLRRWDTPDVLRRFRFPKRRQGAEELCCLLENSKPPRGEDVILHVLRAFRQLRSAIPVRDPRQSIIVLNAFLVGTEAARLGVLDEEVWLGSRTVGDALDALQDTPYALSGEPRVEDTVRGTGIGNLLRHFTEPEPTTGLRLEPGLLLRHAAGQLYQEAHLLIETEHRQLSLPGLASDEMPRGVLQRDVRFTPVALARTLVQQSLDALPERVFDHSKLVILDPACGSGVFLQEALRELQARSYTGTVVLKGFDISPVSCEIARFCLGRSKLDAMGSAMDVKVEVHECDGLAEDWGHPDLVLMNPPFIPWDRMNGEQQRIVSSRLGRLKTGRVDMAMAFVWRGAEALREGAVMASVLPAALLETNSGEKWREALADRGSLRLLGRFRGYGFFRSSMVEPAFLVLARPTGREPQAHQHIRVVIADEGAEGAAMRGLRRHRDLDVPEVAETWEVFDVASGAVAPASWLPRSGRYLRLIEKLSAFGMPRVRELFHVRQGIRTGRNPAFVLKAEDLARLPTGEQGFFRPVADIEEGRSVSQRFVFYPYDDNGPLLNTEQEVQDRVLTYYEQWLAPAKHDLMQRRRVDPARWWELLHERTWQRSRRPKIVTKYFGQRGSFAFDDRGEYVVLQGYAWLWRRESLGDEPHFTDTPLPWAYLALLNSPVFESILACFCPRVKGGQFNLSTRFIGPVPLPDLWDDHTVSADTVQRLAELGQLIHRGNMPDPAALDSAAAPFYGLSGSDARAVRIPRN
ncbi:N-6 DNA methylase [bacterium]|nr:N-6 DNA methylase [bacterium]